MGRKKKEIPVVKTENKEVEKLLNEVVPITPPAPIISIIEEPKRKLILRNNQSPGDIMMLTAAIRDLHMSHPKKFLTDVRTPCGALFENSPYITKLDDKAEGVELIDCAYPLIHKSNTIPYHFVHGFRLFLEEKLNIVIKPTVFKGDIHISAQEKGWINQVQELTGEDTPYWIMVAGGKNDFTAKWWDHNRYQEIVDYFWGKINFVQVGEVSHKHPPLERVINFVGKTDLRQFVRLMYHADGVVCPVTFAMHLAAAVETIPGKPKNRSCVVIAGGREPSTWEAYGHHQYLHTNGALSCCDNGGCWKSRVVPLGDNDSKDHELCVKPTVTESGSIIPKCLDMIKTVDVIRAIEKYLEWNK
jgi:ADP-heptose:LPS heptosyltransferase